MARKPAHLRPAAEAPPPAPPRPPVSYLLRVGYGWALAAWILTSAFYVWKDGPQAAFPGVMSALLIALVAGPFYGWYAWRLQHRRPRG